MKTNGQVLKAFHNSKGFVLELENGWLLMGINSHERVYEFYKEYSLKGFEGYVDELKEREKISF